jgi:hypothetical protein
MENYQEIGKLPKAFDRSFRSLYYTGILTVLSATKYRKYYGYFVNFVAVIFPLVALAIDTLRSTDFDERIERGIIFISYIAYAIKFVQFKRNEELIIDIVVELRGIQRREIYETLTRKFRKFEGKAVIAIHLLVILVNFQSFFFKDRLLFNWIVVVEDEKILSLMFLIEVLLTGSAVAIYTSLDIIYYLQLIHLEANLDCLLEMIREVHAEPKGSELSVVKLKEIIVYYRDIKR